MENICDAWKNSKNLKFLVEYNSGIYNKCVCECPLYRQIHIPSFCREHKCVYVLMYVECFYYRQFRNYFPQKYNNGQLFFEYSENSSIEYIWQKHLKY